MSKVLKVFVLFAGLLASAQDGTVVVYRQGKYAGSALKPSIYVDGNQVARLGNGRYVSLQLTPGKHNFESNQKEAALEVNVKSKDTVYLEMVILNGKFRMVGRLIPVAQEDAKNALVKLKPMDGKQATETSTSPTPQEPAADNSQGESHAESDVQMQPANVTIKSTPPGCDINVDGKFMAALRPRSSWLRGSI
jgi:hypothetical protein